MRATEVRRVLMEAMKVVRVLTYCQAKSMSRLGTKNELVGSEAIKDKNLRHCEHMQYETRMRPPSHPWYLKMQRYEILSYSSVPKNSLFNHPRWYSLSVKGICLRTVATRSMEKGFSSVYALMTLLTLRDGISHSGLVSVRWRKQTTHLEGSRHRSRFFFSSTMENLSLCLTSPSQESRSANSITAPSRLEWLFLKTSARLKRSLASFAPLAENLPEWSSRVPLRRISHSGGGYLWGYVRKVYSTFESEKVR